MGSTQSLTDQEIMFWAYLSFSENTFWVKTYRNPQFLNQDYARCRTIQCKTGLMAQFLGELK